MCKNLPTLFPQYPQCSPSVPWQFFKVFPQHFATKEVYTSTEVPTGYIASKVILKTSHSLKTYYDCNPHPPPSPSYPPVAVHIRCIPDTPPQIVPHHTPQPQPVPVQCSACIPVPGDNYLWSEWWPDIGQSESGKYLVIFGQSEVREEI